MSDETKVPSLPAVTPSNIGEFAKVVKQIIDVREGRIGNPLDANVTYRDLMDAGALVIRPGWNGRTGVPAIPPWTEPDGYDPTQDFLPPQRPESVVVTGMFALVMVQFDAPQYRNHAYAEIWRSPTNAIGNAVLIGTTDTRFYTDSVGTSSTAYYWVRFVSKANVIGPYNAVDGVVGQTATNPALVLGSLSGQIRESHLFSTLSSRIDLVDAPATTPGSVNARLSVIQSQVNDLLNTPTYSSGTTYPTDALVTYNGSIYRAKQTTTGNLPTNTAFWEKVGEYSSLGAAVAAHTTQIGTLTTDLAAEVSARTSLASAVNNPTTGLAATRSTLINDYYTKSAADGAISSAITSLSSQFTNTLTGYVTNARLTNDYYTKTATDSAISQATSSLVSTTSLNSTLGSYVTNAALTTSYYTKTQTDSAISSATSSLVSNTALTNTLGSYVTSATLTANHYTKTQTDSAISSATSTLVSTTALNNALAGYTNTATLQQNYYTKTATDSAISSATSTLVSTAALNTALGNYTTTASLQQNYYTRASGLGLEAQYTLKVDLNGYVSGFGFASTANNATASSAFSVRADSFYIANPTGPSIAPAMPFIVRTTATTINGVSVPAGVYISDAFIQNGTITNAKIGNAAIDDAKIANLSASKITTGFLSADRIQAGSLDAKIANLDAARITSGFIDAARINTASIANAQINGAQIISLDAGKITSGRITASFIDGTNLTINAGGVELGNDVGPGAGHYGLSLSGSDFNNIFIRRNDGVVFFRVNNGGANSLTFDSASGVLNIQGVMSASQIAVGTAGGSTTFFDPAQPSVPLNSSASGFMAYSGDTGLQTWVYATCPDGKGGSYDCSYIVYTAAPITNADLEFRTGTTGVNITKRVRTGAVRFTLTGAGTVDQYLSLWYRIRNVDGSYGAWVGITVATEPQRNYGAAAVSAAITLGLSVGQGVQFGLGAHNLDGNYWNAGARALYDATLTVTGVNF